MTLTPEWIVGAVVAAAVLLVAAFLLGRRTGSGAGRVRELESRLEVAAQERERVEGELRGYRERVAEHFSETSEQLHELTVQYRAVYEHLAKGASELCPESFEKLEGGLGLDALPEESHGRHAFPPADAGDTEPHRADPSVFGYTGAEATATPEHGLDDDTGWPEDDADAPPPRS
jgi:uncharacterized membrane-anchored protein YhcB (DUF1043 family)